MSDLEVVPHARPDVESVAIGPDLVLVDGSHAATVLNATAGLIWSRFDGHASIAQVAQSLSEESGVDLSVVRADVVAVAERLGAAGLLADPTAEHGGPACDPERVGVASAVGDVVVDIELDGMPSEIQRTSEGPSRHEPGLTPFVTRDSALSCAPGKRSLGGLVGREAIVVHWSVSCRYCAALAPRLAALETPLRARGVALVLIASPDEETGAGTPPGFGPEVAMVRGDGARLFGTSATPVAFHLDGGRRLVSAPAEGDAAVLSLALRLAGPTVPSTTANGHRSAYERGPRYLARSGGMCGAGSDPTPPLETRVYDIDGYHVGIGVDSPTTGALLDRLFEHRRVEDPIAGTTFTVTLAGAEDSGGGSSIGSGAARSLFRFHPGGRRLPVRSRDPARVLHALLVAIDDAMTCDEPDGYDGDPGGFATRTIAAVVARSSDDGARVDVSGDRGGHAVLLPSGWTALGPALQPSLARMGLALVDVPRPRIDPQASELVVGAPRVAHDRTVIEAVARPPRPGVGEHPAVVPGRYPLAVWCVGGPGLAEGARLSPAAAAATTCALVEGSDPLRDRIGSLGVLFGRMPAVVVDEHPGSDWRGTVTSALNLRS